MTAHETPRAVLAMLAPAALPQNHIKCNANVQHSDESVSNAHVPMKLQEERGARSFVSGPSA
eukprot:14064947-Alexandrium_andersonii.AAC.1